MTAPDGMDVFPTTLQTIAGRDDTEVLVRTALAAASILELEEDTTYLARNFAGDVVKVTGPAPRPTPDRKTGTARVYDATSFGAYFLKHAQPGQAEVYADPYGPAIVALLNGNGPEPDADVEPDLGWGDHRLALIFRHSPAWQRWAKLDGEMVDQVIFAQHIEDSLPDIIEPEGATMLELAQTFQANTKVDFESGTDLGSGQRQLTYREKVTAGAGALGKIVIPKTFSLGLIPYEGCGRYPIEARLRYRISDGGLKLGYRLDRPEDVLRTAFDGLLLQVQDTTGRIALLGTPPA